MLLLQSARVFFALRSARVFAPPGLNPATVWQYYRLTGVQGHPVNCQPNPVPPADKNSPQTCVSQQNPTTCTGLDPNYFMANFVIESDPFLNNFSGPGFGGNPFKNCNNIVTYTSQSGVTQGAQRDMGGCKGCHGVAQTAFERATAMSIVFSALPAMGTRTRATVAISPARSRRRGNDLTEERLANLLSSGSKPSHSSSRS